MNQKRKEMGIKHSAHQLRVAYDCLVKEGFGNHIFGLKGLKEKKAYKAVADLRDAVQAFSCLLSESGISLAQWLRRLKLT